MRVHKLLTKSYSQSQVKPERIPPLHDWENDKQVRSELRGTTCTITVRYGLETFKHIKHIDGNDEVGGSQTQFSITSSQQAEPIIIILDIQHFGGHGQETTQLHGSDSASDPTNVAFYGQHPEGSLAFGAFGKPYRSPDPKDSEIDLLPSMLAKCGNYCETKLKI